MVRGTDSSPRDVDEELKKVRLAMDIGYRLRMLTPEDLRYLPRETVREALAFLGLDPDKPLPDELVRLIDKMQLEKRKGSELNLVGNSRADAVPEGAGETQLEEPALNDREETGYATELPGEGELIRLVPGSIHSRSREDVSGFERPG